jgi:hypothetical protein
MHSNSGWKQWIKISLNRKKKNNNNGGDEQGAEKLEHTSSRQPSSTELLLHQSFFANKEMK